MIISQIDIVNVLTYRTFRSIERYLRKNGVDNIFPYSGAQEEISGIFIDLEKSNRNYKYPAIFNILPAKQAISGFSRECEFTLCFVHPVSVNTTSEEREKEIFFPILRPIYIEFMNQVFRAEFIEITEYGIPKHSYYDNYATSDERLVFQKYCDVVSAIEVHNLKLTIKKNLCDSAIEEILSECGCDKK